MQKQNLKRLWQGMITLNRSSIRVALTVTKILISILYRQKISYLSYAKIQF